MWTLPFVLIFLLLVENTGTYLYQKVLGMVKNFIDDRYSFFLSDEYRKKYKRQPHRGLAYRAGINAGKPSNTRSDTVYVLPRVLLTILLTIAVCRDGSGCRVKTADGLIYLSLVHNAF